MKLKDGIVINWSGKKTYLFALLGIVYLAGSFAHYWTIDWRILDVIGLLTLMMLKSDLTK